MSTEQFHGIIYKATNKLDGNCYIGKTSQPSLSYRITDHINAVKLNKDKTYFHNAMRKYGSENFEWEILYECDSKTILNIMETFKIMTNHSHVSEGKGYNLTWGGEGGSYKLTEEQLERRRIINKTTPAFLNRHHTVETKEKLRKSMIGNKNSKKYSSDIKNKAIMLIENGETYDSVSKIMNIPQNNIKRWIKKGRQ